MATLTGQTIASSYEQLLSLPDGGGNSTTLVSITDGDAGTTFGFQISTNALMMTSTNQLQFGDTGTYIYQSADGVLDLVSDTEIEINATTIDINGAVEISGNADIAGTANLDNTDIDGTLVVDGSNISLDSTATLNIDNSNTSNGITIGTATSGVPISIGHSVSETTINDNLTVTGDFTVNGTTTTINSTTMQVDDKMIELAHSPSGSEGNDSAVDGGGITLKSSDSDKTILWTNSSDQWHYNQGINITSGDLDVAGDVDISGSITNAAWTGDVIASAYLDADTAHLSGSQTFSGAKSFSADATHTGNIIIDADDKALVLGDDQDASIFSNNAGQIFFVRGQDYSPAAGDVEGWIAMTLGNSSSTSLDILGGEGGNSTILMHSDGGDNDADKWKLDVADGGAFTMNYATTGSYVNHFSMSSAGAVFNEDSADLDFRVESNGNANMLFVDGGNDRVGIGTSSPDFQLEIEKATSGGGAAQSIMAISVGSDGSPAANEGGGIEFRIPYDTTGGYHTTGAGIYAGREDATAANYGGHLAFYTRITGGAHTEKMRIDNAGNVGIGTTSPSAELQVVGNTDFRQIWLTDTDTDDTDQRVGIVAQQYDKDETGAAMIMAHCDSDENRVLIGGGGGGFHAATDIRFSTAANNTTDNGTIRFKIDNNSRISLSNNDSGTSNTVFGYDAGANLDAGSNYNVFIGHNVSDASMNDAVQNVGVGYSALSALTTGDDNTAVGKDTLLALNTGYSNTAIGASAADAMTDGHENVAIGVGALGASTSVQDCVAIGYTAMNANATTGANGAVAIGHSALNALTTGASNTAIGQNASKLLTTGSDNTVVGTGAFDAAADDESNNVAIGNAAMGACDQGSNGGANIDDNVAIGKSALFGGDFGSSSANLTDNVVIGYQAMDGTGTIGGNNNVFVGALSGGGSWTGTESNWNTGIGHSVMTGAMNDADLNTAVGNSALYALTTGDHNVAIGSTALVELTDGSQNVAIGHAAGEHDVHGANVQSPDNCVIIGHSAWFSSTTPTNQTVIGHEARGQADNSVTLGDDNVTAVYMAEDSGATVYAANIELASSTANDPEIHIKNTSGGGDCGILKFTKDGGSAADNDTIASITVYADDDGENSLNFANIFWYSSDVSDGAEATVASFTTRDGGAEKIPLRLNGNSQENYITGSSYNSYSPRSTANTDLVYESAVNGGIKIKFNANGDGYWDGAADNGAADYAEYFESTDGKAIPIGNTVVLENGKVRQAKDSETPIGIVRPHDGCAMVGNSAWSKWDNKYIRDDYGKYEYESYTKTRWFEEISKEEYEKKDKDDTGGVRGGSVRDILGGEKGTYYRQHEYYSDIIPSGLTVPDDAKILEDSSYQRHKINPDYDASKEYKPREERDEWNIIGLLGQIPMTKGQPVASNWIKMKDVSNTVEMYFVK